jgi:hypothetical protein
MPLPAAHSDPPGFLAEVKRVIARTDDVLARSAARLRQADAMLERADRHNAHLRERLDDFRQALRLCSGSKESVAPSPTAAHLAPV